LPAREQVEPTSARASTSIVVTVTRASESRRPRMPPVVAVTRASESRRPHVPPPASSSPSREQGEQMSMRASTSVVVTVTRASRADVRARLCQRRRRRHASKREPTSACTSSSVVVAVMRARAEVFEGPNKPPPQQTLCQEGGQPCPTQNHMTRPFPSSSSPSSILPEPSPRERSLCLPTQGS